MNGISSINSNSYRDYGNFASGKRIQSGADGAAELSIIQKEEAQERSYKAGENNIGSAKDMLNVADGAMSDIADYLQRIRELGVQASNTAVVTDSDRANIQKEIEQLKQGISNIASQTAYNTKTLLDGSNEELRIATDGNGNSLSVGAKDTTLEALGIADFDVTGDFDLKAIDDALAKVSSNRSSVGAQSNALEYSYRYSVNTRQNVTVSKSRLEDLDIPEAISEQKKKETLQEYALFMQKKKQDEEANSMFRMFA